MPKFTVYLAKEGFSAAPRYRISGSDVLEERMSIFAPGVTASQNERIVQFIASQKVRSKVIKQSTSNPNAFYRQSARQKRPWWTIIWGITEPIYVQSADALILIELEGRVFLATHGQGRAFINPLAITHDFGLRTALNVLDPEKLRSTDLFTPSEVAMSTHKRSGKDAKLSEYDIDIYNTLLKAVKGKCLPEYEGLFSSVDGTDSFKFGFKGGQPEFISRCLTLLELYDSATYKDLGFGWIDNFRQVRDKTLIQKLDQLLVTSVAARDPSLLILMPYAFQGFEDVYFSIKRVLRKYSDFQLPEIAIRDYYRMIDRAQITVTVADLKKHLIEISDIETSLDIVSFSVYQSIYFETTFENNSYFLESGIWYLVSGSFLAEVNALVDSLFQNQVQLTLPFRTGTVSARARQTHRNKEYAYNHMLTEHLATLGPAILLDSNLVHDGRDKIEIADILWLQSRDKLLLIHNKYNYGASSLSHLFAQGLVSIEALQDASFRAKADEKITDSRLQFGDRLITRRAEYAVIYGIIMPRNSSGEFHIPMFGKISLEHFSKAIKRMGFDVRIAFIEAVDG